jgi:tRNA A-37 threonylcarbamoyl transferase component Bud32
MKELTHQNVMKLEEVHESQNSIYLILELLEGGELLSYITEKQTLKVPEFQKIMRNMLEALAYMDKCGIMHRDLKPENMILKFKNGRPALTSPSRGERLEASGLRSCDQVRPLGIHVQALRHSRLRCSGSYQRAVQRKHSLQRQVRRVFSRCYLLSDVRVTQPGSQAMLLSKASPSKRSSRRISSRRWTSRTRVLPSFRPLVWTC